MSSVHTIQYSIWLTDKYYSKYSKQYIVLSFKHHTQAETNLQLQFTITGGLLHPWFQLSTVGRSPKKNLEN